MVAERKVMSRVDAKKNLWHFIYMSIERIGTADNREAWLEQRKSYLTASAIYGWRGPDYADPKNKWYFEDNNRAAICQEKFGGVEKEFPPQAIVSMAHGSHDEENIARKFEEGIGFKVETANDMFVNERWPHLAATVDGYVHTEGRGPQACGTNYCQDPDVFPALRSALEGRDTGLLELKKSISVAWARNIVPEYYISQVQTQLHITGMDWAVICAECVCPHPKEKWRKFWDLRPTLIEQDPAWANVLDKCNVEFEMAKESLE
jgi:hypothetical protein